MIIDHGHFTLYVPDLPPDHPHVRAKALHLKNAAGRDWYDLAHATPAPGRMFAQVKDGRVNSVSADPSSLWPIDCTLIETDQPVEIDWRYDGATLGPYVPSLDEVKAGLVARVNREAEAARQRFVTPGAAQALVYAEKAEQARAVLDMGAEAANALSIDEAVADFPVLAAGVGIDAPTLWACAELVVAKNEAWVSAGGAIERTRLMAKKAIGDAATAEAARQAYEAVSWPS